MSVEVCPNTLAVINVAIERSKSRFILSICLKSNSRPTVAHNVFALGVRAGFQGTKLSTQH